MKKLIVFSMLLSTSAWAGGYAMLGAGNDACEKLTSAWNSKGTRADTLENAVARAEYVSWMQGFASAAVQMNPRMNAKLSKPSGFLDVLTKVLSVCGEQPEKSVASVLADELNRLGKK